MGTQMVSGAYSRHVDNPQKVRELVRTEMRAYRLFLVGSDLLLTFLAFYLAYQVRFYTELPFYDESIIPQVPTYTNFMLYSIPIWLIIYAASGLYRANNLLGGTQEYGILFNAVTLGVLLIVSLGFLFPDDLILARGWVILTWVFAFLLTATGRFLARRAVYALRRRGYFQNLGVLVGANEEGFLLADQLLQSQTSGIRLMGYVDNERNPQMDGNLEWFGKTDRLSEIIEKNGISEIILTSSAFSQEHLLAIFRKFGTAQGINVRMSSGLYEIITTGMEVKEDGLVPLVTINKVRMTGVDEILKTILDYCLAVPLTILLSPLMALIALAVRLDSPGPIIYRRRVMGVNGKQFDAFKFRTMQVNSDEILASNPELLNEYKDNFKIKDDPRITNFGRILRKTSLDELPQLFNVLRFEMSLVGPRMITPEELGKYSQWDLNLLTVKPGITGLWQVHGRSDVSYEERVRLDMHYIRNWTIWFDLHLLMETIPAVLSRRGAY
jgi:exopolysaccharide biosynthesis polyprenyl glycosylphosphotransferase